MGNITPRIGGRPRLADCVSNRRRPLFSSTARRPDSHPLDAVMLAAEIRRREDAATAATAILVTDRTPTVRTATGPALLRNGQYCSVSLTGYPHTAPQGSCVGHGTATALALSMPRHKDPTEGP